MKVNLNNNPMAVRTSLLSEEALQQRLDAVNFLDIPEVFEPQHIGVAWGCLKMKVETRKDLLFFLAATNYLNAWVKQEGQKEYKSLIYKQLKRRVSQVFTSLICHPLNKVRLYYEEGKMNCAYIEVEGWLFSFHRIPVNSRILCYAKSEKNQKLLWKGKRLQPIAATLLEWNIRREKIPLHLAV
ncbi:hypothetical protein [Algivirga pacifica]|uniref:Uncharacterized protein n=1 Tax=Algivirga pacifica TaxID=1162670 RepID=A0ABP9D4B3_9BACT